MGPISKNRIPSQNNLTLNIILSKGLIMPCANYTMMGFATNVVLTVNHSTSFEIKNEFVTSKSNKQPTISWFIL
jgi:hypothetical protein